MTQSIIDNLIPSCEQVLETMFFTGVLSSGEHMPCNCPGSLCANVRFEGPPDGEFRVCFANETAGSLASSFLGLAPDEVTSADCEQVAGELANMFCGSVLSRSVPSGEFHLTVTQEHDPVQDLCDFCVALELPEGPLNVCIRVDRL